MNTLSPTGNVTPFSIWVVECNPFTNKPTHTELCATFRYMQEAIEYGQRLGARGVSSTLRGMGGYVSQNFV